MISQIFYIVMLLEITFFDECSSQEIKSAAQGSGAVPIPEGVQKTRRCGTSGHGLAGMVVMG